MVNKHIALKIIIMATAVLISPIFFWPELADAGSEDINLYFFYGDGCPHCVKEEIFLNKLESERQNIKIYRYETWSNSSNARLLSELGQELGVDVPGVPMLFIGDKAVTGYFSDEVTGKQIIGILDKYNDGSCTDIIGPIINEGSSGNICPHGCDQNDQLCEPDCGCSNDTATTSISIPDTVQIPFFGEIEVKNISLPIFTFLLAAADGFNPCAMWALVFLISLLINMKDRRRMFILGSTFIIVSGLVYFLFLTAWLNLFMVLGYVKWVRAVIAVVALASGTWHIKKAYDNRDGGCHVVGSGKRKKIISRVRDLVGKKNFIVAFIGIVLLAVAVNLVELVCSAGLPAVYTQVLSLSDLPAYQYYAYLFFYIFIYMLDDLAIFFIAMATLRMSSVGSSLSKYSGWVGGVVMIIVGLLLIFQPGWLMFG